MKQTHPQRRVLVVIGSIICQFCVGMLYSWSVFQTPISQMFGWDTGAVSLTFSISTFWVLGAWSDAGCLRPPRAPAAARPPPPPSLPPLPGRCPHPPARPRARRRRRAAAAARRQGRIFRTGFRRGVGRTHRIGVRGLRSGKLRQGRGQGGLRTAAARFGRRRFLIPAAGATKADQKYRRPRQETQGQACPRLRGRIPHDILLQNRTPGFPPL